MNTRNHYQIHRRIPHIVVQNSSSSQIMSQVSTTAFFDTEYHFTKNKWRHILNAHRTLCKYGKSRAMSCATNQPNILSSSTKTRADIKKWPNPIILIYCMNLNNSNEVCLCVCAEGTWQANEQRIVRHFFFRNNERGTTQPSISLNDGGWIEQEMKFEMNNNTWSKFVLTLSY